MLRLWQGLGYYSRARNLHATAKHVHEYLGGEFPNTYLEIIKLKGVGPYTAAAISSICFDEVRPVVDGNVFRFISRYFGIDEDISGSKARNVFEKLLQEYIDTKNPGDFNQAVMEYGATVCAPKPTCDDCLFRLDCFAFAKNKQSEFPVKTKKIKTRDRLFHYVVFTTENRFLLNQRLGKDVWNSLFDFYLIEGEKDEEDMLKAVTEMGIMNPVIDEISETFVHILSHQKIHAIFYRVAISKEDAQKLMEKTKLGAYTENEMLNLPKAKLIVNYLQRFVT